MALDVCNTPISTRVYKERPVKYHIQNNSYNPPQHLNSVYFDSFVS